MNAAYNNMLLRGKVSLMLQLTALNHFLLAPGDRLSSDWTVGYRWDIYHPRATKFTLMSYRPLDYSLRPPPTCHARHEIFSGNGAHGRRAGSSATRSTQEISCMPYAYSVIG
jgi:hypothetical protein